MTAPDIQLSTDEVRSHADRVAAQVESIHQAGRAASQVAMDDQAYGLICSPLLVPLLNHLETLTIDTIGGAADSIESIAELLHTLAANTDASDAAAHRRLVGGGG